VDSCIISVLRFWLQQNSSGMKKSPSWPAAGDLPPFCQLLLNHGFLGVYEAFLKKNQLWDQAPLEIRDFLEKGLAAQWTANMHLAALQDWVSDLLEEENVSFLIFKGLPLSERLYGNALIRPVGDVDLVVKPKDFVDVYSFLKDKGFRVQKSVSEEYYRKNHFHLPLVSEKFPGILEVHWGLSDHRFSFPIEEIFSRLERQKISERDLWIMDPTDEILYLTYHHANHYLLFRWIWLMDVTLWLIRYGNKIDYQELAQRMKRFRLQKPFLASLYYCQYYFRENIPADIRFKLEDFYREQSFIHKQRKLLHFLADPKKPFSNRVVKYSWARKSLALSLVSGVSHKANALARKIYGATLGK